MEEAYGYNQLRINYIKDHAKTIYEQSIQLENTWHNRNIFSVDDKTLKDYFENQQKQIEENMRYLKSYLEPHD